MLNALYCLAEKAILNRVYLRTDLSISADEVLLISTGNVSDKVEAAMTNVQSSCDTQVDTQELRIVSEYMK